MRYRKYKRDFTRRDFLAAAGGAIGLVAASLGLPVAALGKEEIEFIRTSCGQDQAEAARVLIAYDSRYGTTGEVAEAVAKEICAAGAACDVKLAKEVEDLGPYAAVIVGSAVRNFGWMPDAVNFVKSNANALKDKKVAYFMTCLQILPQQPHLNEKMRKIEGESEDDRKKRVLSYLDPVLKQSPQVLPKDIGVFAGVIKFDMLTRTDRMLMKNMGFVEGDFRDWDAIKAWARKMAEALLKK